jgi:hypothetical protein
MLLHTQDGGERFESFKPALWINNKRKRRNEKMACNITAQVLGGKAQTGLEASTVRELVGKLGLDNSYSATVNGKVAGLDTKLEEYNFVTFAPNVKGGKTVTVFVKGSR